MWFVNNVMFVQWQVTNVLCAGCVFDEGVEEMNEHIGRGYDRLYCYYGSILM